jgi:hypothetical protein
MNVKAISHILNRSEIYRKPEDVQRLLARIVGEGESPYSNIRQNKFLLYLNRLTCR